MFGRKRSTPQLRQRRNDADIAAGPEEDLVSVPSSVATINTKHGADLEIFDDLVSDPVLVLGFDISHMPKGTQFTVCATGVFGFSLLYGYLQELISVHICNRKLGLFQAVMQFVGYSGLAYWMNLWVYSRQEKLKRQREEHQKRLNPSYDSEVSLTTVEDGMIGLSDGKLATTAMIVPWSMYVSLSLLRAVDLGMTNLAMQYINYPAKTLMKSSRVVFTMFFGVVISRKRYSLTDYSIVMFMVVGLALFMHADMNSSAVFHSTGVIMLIISLICDGAISNVSETIMSKYGVGQDEFIFRMYSIALVAITVAAAFNGDLREGMTWLFQPGTYDEYINNAEVRTWSVTGKIMVMSLFSSMGFFGSSCSAAITKNFGALTMSITSTARKATTLFLSFFIFKNVCTLEHVSGIVLFIAALTTKSLRRGRKSGHKKTDRPNRRLVDRTTSSSSTTRPPMVLRTSSRSSVSSRTPRSSQSLAHVV